VYALLDARPRRALPPDFDGRLLALVAAAGLWAAVSRRPTAPPLDARALRAHDATIRALSAMTPALLPVRFGTLVTDAAALTQALAPRTAALGEALALVREREQMTLRVRGAAPIAEPVAVARGRGREPGPGTRYLAARRAAMERARAVPQIDALRARLGALVKAERVERHPGATHLVSVYHLIPRGRSRTYLAAVRREAAGGNAVLRATGPWPPYAFAPDPLP
jgi:hypothetical protein